MFVIDSVHKDEASEKPKPASGAPKAAQLVNHGALKQQANGATSRPSLWHGRGSFVRTWKVDRCSERSQRRGVVSGGRVEVELKHEEQRRVV